MFKKLVICGAVILAIAPAPLFGQSTPSQLVVEARPAFEMGGDGGTPSNPLLARVRAGTRTRNGYAIADAAARSLFLYDSLGRFERAVGRQGRGPG